jgi:uncharacterized membrane protein YhiD involved in acid resistance
VPKEIQLFESNAPFSITLLLLNLMVGVVLALAILAHYRRFGSTLTNREELGQVIPTVLLTIILIISVVKSSLALSLGLVGALSIVRFRTPIKEPEELAYLFIAIATGLGLGANQTLPTVLACLFILIVMAGIKKFRSSKEVKSVYLSLDLEIDPADKATHLEELNNIISNKTEESDIRRYDLHDNMLEATYYVRFQHVHGLASLSEQLRASYSGIGITFLDQSQLPSF